MLELANRADLARICAIAWVFGDLLQCAGVDTVKETGYPSLQEWGCMIEYPCQRPQTILALIQARLVN